MNTETTLFRAFTEDELPHIQFRATRDEALADAVARLPEGNTESIIIQQVRAPALSDFYDFSDLVSMMRERMQGLIGNDDALSSAETNEAVAKLVDRDIRTALDAAAGLAALRIDGYIVVNAELFDPKKAL